MPRKETELVWTNSRTEVKFLKFLYPYKKWDVAKIRTGTAYELEAQGLVDFVKESKKSKSTETVEDTVEDTQENKNNKK